MISPNVKEYLLELLNTVRITHFDNLRPIQGNKAASSPPRLIPSFLVLNARSTVKPDALPALCAGIKCCYVDVCCISETWLNRLYLTLSFVHQIFPSSERIQQTVVEVVSRSYAGMIGECSQYVI